MKKHFSLLGLFFGILLANKSNASLFYLLIFAMIFAALFCVEKWGLKKFEENKKIIGLANSLIFIIVTLTTAMLYVGFLSEAFLKVFIVSSVIALIFIYLPNIMINRHSKKDLSHPHVIVKEE